jgi:iron complex outermembrane recepter protein
MTRHNALRLAILASLATASAAHAQTTAAPPVARTAAMEEIVVTGTRVAERSAIETAVPVDVVSAETLTNTGVTELNQALSIALPSFNFPRPAWQRRHRHGPPATLRGLAPDQTLVLVNSKRRHQRRWSTSTAHWTRLVSGGSEHHSDRGHSLGRGAARRCFGAVRV